MTEELKMILESLQGLGVEAKWAFVAYLVWRTTLFVASWVGALTIVWLVLAKGVSPLFSLSRLWTAASAKYGNGYMTTSVVSRAVEAIERDKP